MLNRLCRLGAAYASVLKFVDELDAAPGAYMRAFGIALDGILQQYVDVCTWTCTCARGVDEMYHFGWRELEASACPRCLFMLTFCTVYIALHLKVPQHIATGRKESASRPQVPNHRSAARARTMVLAAAGHPCCSG